MGGIKEEAREREGGGEGGRREMGGGRSKCDNERNLPIDTTQPATIDGAMPRRRKERTHLELLAPRSRVKLFVLPFKLVVNLAFIRFLAMVKARGQTCIMR